MEPPQIRRNIDRLFYTAIIKINDLEKFQKVAKAMKYFTIEGKPCRALPFDRELQGANRQNLAKQNVFLKHIPAHLSSEDVEKLLAKEFECEVKSCKVSINPDYTSREYGFALFQRPEDAEKAVKVSKIKVDDKEIDVLMYNPRDKKDMKRIVNNIYVKNFP